VKYKIILVFLSILVFQLVEIDPSYYNGVCLTLILLIGVPHGAADHRINTTLIKGASMPKFILQYILIAVGYTIWWILMPIKAALMFYVLSIYHFGQEFMEELNITKPKTWEIMVWGSSILLLPSLIAYQEISSSLEWFSSDSSLQLNEGIRTTLISVIPIAMLFSLYQLRVQGRISSKKALRSILFLSVLNISYLFLPFLVAFTLYFILFHSLNAFNHQFDWLKNRIKNYNLGSLLKDLGLFSFMSISGLLFLIYFMRGKEFSEIVSYFFMIISVVTLPHALLFDKFYKLRKEPSKHVVD
jgi:Brp/Blh family beta-carotene 15,15'-monooxygenase